MKTASRAMATALSLVVLVIPTSLGGAGRVSASSPAPTAIQLVKALDNAKTRPMRIRALENIFATGLPV